MHKYKSLYTHAYLAREAFASTSPGVCRHHLILRGVAIYCVADNWNPTVTKPTLPTGTRTITNHLLILQQIARKKP